jgi:Ca2+-transporting ATPase
VLPEQKLKIVEGLQKLGHRVAVTGDGINDAPALKKADIGIAMGKGGTEVAKEAAGLVLLDDDFSTIVRAIRNGRKIYDNIQKAFSYLVAFHLPIFLSALIIPIMGLPLLLVPVAIVLLELVLHPVVSIVFEVQPAEPEVMKRAPRSGEAPILERRQLGRLLTIGVAIFLLSAASYVLAYSSGYGEPRARSLGLSVMLVGQLILIPSELSSGRVKPLELFRNRYFDAMAALVLVLYLIAMYSPLLEQALQIGALALTDWMIVALGAVATLVVAELTKTRKQLE